MDEIFQIKTAYKTAVDENNLAVAANLASRLLSLSPTLGTAQLIVNTLTQEIPGRLSVKKKVAFLRSYTVEPAIPLMRALSRIYGIDLIVKVGAFNAYTQEIIDTSSWLYQFDPDIVIIAVQTRDIAPSVWYGLTDVRRDGAPGVVEDLLSPILSLIVQLRTSSNAAIIVQAFEQPTVENAGLMDSRRSIGQSELIREMNHCLNRFAVSCSGVYVLDYDGLIARHGRLQWVDEKKWLTSRSPISADCLIYIAREYLRFIVPLSNRQCKVLAVDLDNTLWGGVVGEDGVSGILIGQEYPGAAYLAMQRAILDIRDRGVLLAVSSKNNEADALEALDKRQEMLLRSHHFAAIRINWKDKSQNLREIAAELNVGIENLAFVDDNPVERHRILLELPEVTVIDLPPDPSGYAAALRASPVFERLSVTAEDRNRGQYYAEQRDRKQLELSSTSLEDFYRSLQMSAEIVSVGPDSVARIAQLTQKTNQFNMTTRRYSESEVLSLNERANWQLFGIRIVDRFGDNGIVGVVFLHILDDIVDIDTFLLSCRVIGRTVETAMLAYCEEIARSAGCKRIRGWFLQTRKNDPASQVYCNHRFECVERSESGILWELNLTDNSIASPEWIAKQFV